MIYELWTKVVESMIHKIREPEVRDTLPFVISCFCG